MPKSSLEKSIEKQEKEAKKRADQELRQKRAELIISGQPIINGMRIMDKASEEVFQVILDRYRETQNNAVSGAASLFPEMYRSSLLLEFEKLSMYGMITCAHVWIDISWEAIVTPQGVTYFEDKQKAMETEKAKPANTHYVSDKEYDVFISHASKDKLDYVDLLYLNIQRLGVKVFYDTESISWGDDWKQVILEGTEKSEFAIIVISENFFDREWTERELNEFLKRQNESGQKIVLPLLHGISVERLKEKYPFLGNIQVIDTERFSKEEIVILFAKELIKRLKCS